MNVTLYKYSGNLRKIDKTLPSGTGNILTLSGYLKDGSSVLNPTILVNYTIDIVGFNYAYISDFSRYYFVEISNVNKDLWELRMRVDVLKTYATTILNTQMNIDRCMLADYKIADETTSFECDFKVNILNLSSAVQGDLQNFSFESCDWNDGYPLNNPSHNVMINVVNDNGQQSFYYPLGDMSYKVTPLITNMSEWSLCNSNVLPYSYKYVGDMQDLNTIKEIYQQTEADFIKSIIVFPFPIDIKTDSQGLKQRYYMRLGSTDYTNGRFYEPYETIFDYKVLLDYTFPSFTTSYLNYEPYTEIELFIPFIGWKKFNASELYGNRILIAYQVNYEDGSAVCYVLNKTKDYIIMQSTCQLGVKVALSRSNLEELNAQRISNTTSMVLGVLGGAVSTSLGALTGNPLAVVGGVMATTNAITKGVVSNMGMFERGQTQIASANDGLSSGFNVLRKTITKTPRYRNGVIGYPFKTNSSISSLPDGYVKVMDTPNIAITGTKSEADEIVTLLKDYVIK